MTLVIGTPPLAVTGSLRTNTRNPAPNATFEVQDASTLDPVAIYSDNTLTTEIVLPITDALGNYSFYVPSGTYIMVADSPTIDDSQVFQVFNNVGPGTASGDGAPTDATYLVATANAGLSAEIAVGATPGGELGGTWAAPTIDAIHSGSSHADAIKVTGGGIETYQDHGNAGATETVDLANGNIHRLVLDANCTLTVTGATNAKGCSVTFVIVQDATGSRTITWPASFKWPGGVAAAIGTAANSVSIVTAITVDGGTTWLAMLGGAVFS